MLATELMAMKAFEATEVFSWAHNNLDAPAWEFHDLDPALEHVQALLREHAPIDGVFGMSQGGMIGQIAAAQASCGVGGSPSRGGACF